MTQWSANTYGSRHKPMILYFHLAQTSASGKRSPLVTMDDTRFAWDIVERLAQVRRQTTITDIRPRVGDCQQMADFWTEYVCRYASKVTRLRQAMNLDLWRVVALLLA